MPKARIILPVDTTVTVGDTLWWGVEAIDHEERRTVEVERMPWPGEWDDVAPGTETPVPLGHAVIDGDWVSIVDARTWGEHPYEAVVIDVDGKAYFFARDDDDGTRITLHGHTDPGGYAARFEVIA